MIRAGAGICYDFPDELWWTLTGDNPPLMVTYNIFASAGNPLLISNPYPISEAAVSVPSIEAFQPNPRTPLADEWMLDVQHSFSKDMMLDVAYVGNKASFLPRRTTLNVPIEPGPGSIQARRPLPDWGSVAYMQFDAPSTYEALQVK